MNTDRLAKLTAIRDQLVHLLTPEEQDTYPAIDHLQDLIDDLSDEDDEDEDESGKIQLVAKLPQAGDAEAQPQESAEPSVASPPPPTQRLARDQAAAVVGASGRSVQMAKAVSKSAPDLAHKVERGEIPTRRNGLRQSGVNRSPVCPWWGLNGVGPRSANCRTRATDRRTDRMDHHSAPRGSAAARARAPQLPYFINPAQPLPPVPPRRTRSRLRVSRRDGLPLRRVVRRARQYLTGCLIATTFTALGIAIAPTIWRTVPSLAADAVTPCWRWLETEARWDYDARHLGCDLEEDETIPPDEVPAWRAR